MIGLLGGTFDPIHFGHLRMAQELLEGLDLSQVLFIPAAMPPHKNEPMVPTNHRAEMVRLAIKDNPKFSLDERELNREHLSYTVDTLVSVRQELGPSMPLCLLMGSDAFLGLPTWHHWKELLTLSHIVVAHRPNSELLPEDMPVALRPVWEKCATTQIKDLSKKPAGHILAQHITALDISATKIREDFKCHLTPHYLMPESVINYIRKHRLY